MLSNESDWESIESEDEVLSDYSDSSAESTCKVKCDLARAGVKKSDLLYGM